MPSAAVTRDMRILRGAVALALLLSGVCGPPAAAREAPPVQAEPRAGYVALSSAPPQKTELRLPFDGIWGVLQGMNSDGTHTGYAAYALDFVPAEPAVSEAVVRRRAKLTDFPCYGRPILAPADARVVWVHDGEPELPPFKESPRYDPGNLVILQHAVGELTEFRHLQRGSIVVKVGDRVRSGDVLGRCGNSGNAVTPHLHVGFLGSYRPIATRPMRLSSYEVLSGRGVWRAGDGIPTKGQILRHVPEPPRGR